MLAYLVAYLNEVKDTMIEESPIYNGILETGRAVSF